MPEPGFLGRQLDRGPTPAPVTETGGPSGTLLSGGAPPQISAARADGAVAGELARELKPAGRLALAQASQQAAIAERLTQVAWSASAEGQTTASGWVMPVSDPYRGQHGRICRDLRQAMAEGEQAVVQAVTLCQETVEGGLRVWTLPHFP